MKQNIRMAVSIAMIDTALWLCRKLVPAIPVESYDAMVSGFLNDGIANLRALRMILHSDRKWTGLLGSKKPVNI